MLACYCIGAKLLAARILLHLAREHPLRAIYGIPQRQSGYSRRSRRRSYKSFARVQELRRSPGAGRPGEQTWKGTAGGLESEAKVDNLIYTARDGRSIPAFWNTKQDDDSDGKQVEGARQWASTGDDFSGMQSALLPSKRKRAGFPVAAATHLLFFSFTFSHLVGRRGFRAKQSKAKQSRIYLTLAISRICNVDCSHAHCAWAVLSCR